MANAASKHTPADREYIGSLSPHILMEFRDYVREAVPPSVSTVSVKAEPDVQHVASVKTRTLHVGEREVIELLSDSEPQTEDLDSDLEVIEALQPSRSSSVPPLSDADHSSKHDSDFEELDGGSDDENSDDLMLSDTVWLDDGTSQMISGRFRPSQKVTVERMEYRNGAAAVYPIHRVRTGIVVDLSDPKYHFRDASKALVPLTTVIMDADNDSWKWLGGSASANVTFSPSEKAISCRSIRYECKGAHACDQLDAALRTAVRFELDDLAPRQAIVLAQQETRRTEGNTPEERVVLFINMIRKTKCNAIDSMGKPCRGGPILKPKPQGPSRGHELFVGCTHAHIVNGLQVQGEIKNYPCTALRWIYVPKDSSIRQVLIIHNDLGHNHPCPALSKVTFGHKDTYRRCIQANGVLGATVAKIDNAQSTKMLLAGKTPAAHAAPLHNKRAKRSILHAEKLQKYPNGLGVDAIYSIYRAELTKPLPERYVHSYIETPKGEKIIVTFVVYLLKLLDDPGVTSFDGDTTFKGVEGKMNEWELTIFAKVVQRAASVLRAYINGSSADFFELLFDELQKRKLEVTGKPIAFKIFVPGGNLLVANVDMDTAQVIGLCRSVLSFSDPEYSRIPKDTPPKQIAPKFIKSCLRHGKEPIHDFRALVSPAQLARLQDCFYLDSVESLNTFSSFVYGLNIQKISDWWRHKEIDPWIIPCIIKSQSQIPADIWDATPSTTNTNEAQHHWTNSLTGTKLTPVEALESRRRVDQNVADEIKMSLKTGILSNSNNELSHRMARNSQRQSAVARRATESRDAANVSKDLQRRIDEEAEKRRLSNETTKFLKAQLKDAKEVPTPAAPVQSDYVPSAPVATSTSGEELSVDEASSHRYSSPEPTMNTWNGNLDFDSLIYDLPAINTDGNWYFLQDPSLGSFLSTYNPASDPTLFMHSNTSTTSHAYPEDPTQNFTDIYGLRGAETAMPSAASPEDPLQDLLDLYGGAGSFPGTQATHGFTVLTSTPYLDAPLPILPPPPPESPCAPSPVVQQVSEPGSSAPRSRRGRQEVDEANIIHTTRTRVPSARKRGADDDDEADVTARPPKKAKANTYVFLLI
ncbi:hypothetical protein B0H10DRAFT_2249742 [Mycena sp. CBHHK59/15]|nr:hypothetical protein B0H10DRAFT_2249742 [Mycena sp. CBHHK59/15]